MKQSPRLSVVPVEKAQAEGLGTGPLGNASLQELISEATRRISALESDRLVAAESEPVAKPAAEPIRVNESYPSTAASVTSHEASSPIDAVEISRPQIRHAIKQTNGGDSYLLPFLFLALFGFFYYRTQIAVQPELVSDGARDHTQLDNFASAWSSFIPSRMLEVAEVAVTGGQTQTPERKAAESVIVASVRAGDVPVSGVNSALIRIAYNEAWELELTPDDRRAALALGLGGILKGKFPTDLKPLDSLHPGVLLALVATINDTETARDHLSEIPAVILTRLPSPFGFAFKRLINGRSDMTCGDPAIELLSRIATNGPEAADLSRFLAQDPELRIQSLAMIMSRSAALAEKTLSQLVNQPGQLQSAQWARVFKITEWIDTPAVQKLFIVAGITPSTSLSAERLGQLLGHPAPVIRAYAAGQLKDTVHFEHPGAQIALAKIQANGSLLTQEQLVGLARILATKPPFDLEVINRWISLNPSPEILSALLLSTAGSRTSTSLDTMLVVALQKTTWAPGIDELRKLSTHPDRSARLYAYGLIFKLEDKESARDLLRFAFNDEKDEQCRENLTQLLSAL